MGRVLAALVAVAACLPGAGCKGSGTCPSGTLPMDGYCLIIDDVATAEDETSAPDILDDAELDLVFPELPDVDDGAPDPAADAPDPAADLAGDTKADTVPEAASEVDERPGPEVYPGGYVGKNCKTDSECATTGGAGSCLQWGGKAYCSILHCGKSLPCPDNSVCLGITPNAPACVATCTTDDDCRAGFWCKHVPDASGTQVNACWPVSAHHLAGDACAAPEECDGAATCLTSFASGYCAVLFCDSEASCPADTHCVRVNGIAACMKACAADGDCTTGSLARSCLQTASVDPDAQDLVKVCGSGTSGVGIGQKCLNDTECASPGHCVLSYTGNCSTTTMRGCKVDLDCPAGEFCLQSPTAAAGYCTQSCTGSCPGANFCIYSESTTGGDCLPACTGVTDKSCLADAGLVCLFGNPKGQAEGHYSCARLKFGALGAPCANDDACSSGATCLAAVPGSGYCRGACQFAGTCPFPTVCTTVGGQATCLRRCLGTDDCPRGMACSVPTGATDSVCYLP